MCEHPTTIWIKDQTGDRHGQIPQEVGCRNCWQCRSVIINDMVGRCLVEAATSDWTRIIRLSYRDQADMSHRVLTPKHVQLFLKRLRRTGYKIRYLAVGEYGGLHGRAHFHVMLFGRGRAPDWTYLRNIHIDEWPHGHVYVDEAATERSVRYLVKYMYKGGVRNSHEFWRSLSKKPHLGAQWFADHARDHVEAGIRPTSLHYSPDGSGPYYLRGVARREYLALFERLWAEQWPDRHLVDDGWHPEIQDAIDREARIVRNEERKSETVFDYQNHRLKNGKKAKQSRKDWAARYTRDPDNPAA